MRINHDLGVGKPIVSCDNRQNYLKSCWRGRFNLIHLQQQYSACLALCNSADKITFIMYITNSAIVQSYASKQNTVTSQQQQNNINILCSRSTFLNVPCASTSDVYKPPKVQWFKRRTLLNWLNVLFLLKASKTQANGRVSIIRNMLVFFRPLSPRMTVLGNLQAALPGPQDGQISKASGVLRGCGYLDNLGLASRLWFKKSSAKGWNTHQVEME